MEFFYITAVKMIKKLHTASFYSFDFHSLNFYETKYDKRKLNEFRETKNFQLHFLELKSIVCLQKKNRRTLKYVIVNFENYHF